MRIWIFRMRGSGGEDPEEKTERSVPYPEEGILIGPVIFGKCFLSFPHKNHSPEKTVTNYLSVYFSIFE